MPGFFLRKHVLPRLRRWAGQAGWHHRINALDGGIDPPDAKPISLRQTPVRMPSEALPLPDELVVVLQQHQGAISHAIVRVGDYVYKNQRIAEASGERGIHHHAPTSGHVVDVSRLVPVGTPAVSQQHSWQQGLYRQVPAIVIVPDGLHVASPQHSAGDDKPWEALSAQQLLQRVVDAGISGMGGAGFPAASKLAASGIHTVVINGAECEPWITADEALMQWQPAQILQGALIIGKITGAQRCLVAIEDNKKAAIHAMREALAHLPANPLELVLIPSLYPSGSEKQLVRIVTGLEVPSTQHPPQVGVLCHSVATAKAVADAVLLQQPLISRMTTVTGPGVSRPQNVEALIGTPVSTLLALAGLKPQAANAPVLIGGPLMGYPAPSVDVPLAKTFNCLLVDSMPADTHAQPHRDCIRCDFCADVCPVKLQPQTLYFMARHERDDQAQAHALFDCIECGACSAVCPSKIPLVSYYREQKASIREHHARQAQSQHWRQAFEHNRERLQVQAVEQEQRRLEKLQHKLAALDKGETLSRTPETSVGEPAVLAADPVISDASGMPAELAAAIKTPEQIRADIEAAVARTRARKAALQQTKADTAGADKDAKQ